MEDTKDLDLLQRLALAWECPPEQLKDITEEVDAWLRDRPDNKVCRIFDKLCRSFLAELLKYKIR